MAFTSPATSLSGRTVVIVGTGPEALRASRSLIDAGAHVRWFVDDVDAGEEVLFESRPGQTEIIIGEPQPQDLADAAVVLVPERTAIPAREPLHRSLLGAFIGAIAH
jgi:siroheme synthase (precorrin-2 oxidase/ferrochelatase)